LLADQSGIGVCGGRGHPGAAHRVAVVLRQVGVELLREPVELHRCPSGTSGAAPVIPTEAELRINVSLLGQEPQGEGQDSLRYSNYCLSTGSLAVNHTCWPHYHSLASYCTGGTSGMNGRKAGRDGGSPLPRAN